MRVNLVTNVPTGSSSNTVAGSLSMKNGISSLTSSTTIWIVVSLTSPSFCKIVSQWALKVKFDHQDIPQHVLADCIPWSSQSQAARGPSHPHTSVPRTYADWCRMCRDESIRRKLLSWPRNQSWGEILRICTLNQFAKHQTLLLLKPQCDQQDSVR